MTTTAHEDQFTAAPEPVREPMSREAILRQNIATLEVALRQQTELKEKAEAELAKLREQKPVAWRHENGNIFLPWQKDLIVTGAVFSPLFAAPVPAPHPGATHCDDCGLTWLDDGLNPLWCPYCKESVPAPAVPEEWRRAVSEFLSSHDAAWAELFKSLPADTRSVTVSNHQADAVRKANALRALLQSAEVTDAAADRMLENENG